MQVYIPAQDAKGLQKAALQQVMLFLVAQCDRHASTELKCGTAAVLTELAAVEHSLVTERTQTALQLAWEAGAFHGRTSPSTHDQLTSASSATGTSAGQHEFPSQQASGTYSHVRYRGIGS